MKRFVANRRTFAQDMSDDEGATMGRLLPIPRLVG